MVAQLAMQIHTGEGGWMEHWGKALVTKLYERLLVKYHKVGFLAKNFLVIGFAKVYVATVVKQSLIVHARNGCLGLCLGCRIVRLCARAKLLGHFINRLCKLVKILNGFFSQDLNLVEAEVELISGEMSSLSTLFVLDADVDVLVKLLEDSKHLFQDFLLLGVGEFRWRLLDIK